MLTEQDGACAICTLPFEAKPKAINVDHCHATGRVRGLLCSRCNLGIGMFRDSAQMLRRAAEYVMPQPVAEDG